MRVLERLEAMTGISRHETLDGVRNEALRALDLHADAVEDVAAALAEQRTLDADDLTALLGEQTPPWWDR